MFLLQYFPATMLVPLGRGSIQSSINLGETLFPNNARMKDRTDLNLGEVVYISIIYHIPDSWLNVLNGYDFYF